MKDENRVFMSVSIGAVVALDEMRQPGESCEDALDRIVFDKKALLYHAAGQAAIKEAAKAKAAKAKAAKAKAAPLTVDPPVVTTPVTGWGDSLVQFLKSREFLTQPDVTKQFTAILSHVIGQQQDAESILTGAKLGRWRVYFGTEGVVRRSGKKTSPNKIPGTKIYALTGLSSEAKRVTLGKVLDVLGYDKVSIALAQAALIDPDQRLDSGQRPPFTPRPPVSRGVRPGGPARGV